jgi:pyruvyltransferase
MIRMYWWQGGGGSGNFGDKLAPALVRALSGREVEYSAIEKSDLLAIGSLLEPWFWPADSWLNYRGAIWGPGRMFGKGPLTFPRANIVGVRGELTLGRLGDVGLRDIVTGDPGLLCGHLHRPGGRTRHKLGIWPHWSEYRNPRLRALLDSSPDILLIDPCGGVRETLDRAASCEYIAASSLHGLIVADALAIPNCWMRLNTGREDAVGMPMFKYLDYYSAFQSPPPVCKVLEAFDTLDNLLPLMSSERHQDAARIQDDLLSAFPYHRVAALI